VPLTFKQLPDGLRSLIGWMVNAMVLMDAWLQGKGNIRDTEALFLLDEIESHLHPTWQRRVLPAFQRLFPKAQMFVSTHSPFVVSSLNHGWIHRFDLHPDGSVTVQKPMAASAGDSYLFATEEVLGLREWFDPETERELAHFRDVRAKALSGDADSTSQASSLARKLAERSPELRMIMGRELAQLGKAFAGVNEPR
jgi:predicted ATP-binding protein involved in virulence